MSQIGMELTGNTDMLRFVQSTVPKQDGTPGYGFSILRRLAKNQFWIKHRGQLPGAGEFLSIP